MSTGQQTTVTRTIEAPADAVWRAWTQPAQFAAWFGTPPFRTPADRVVMDVRVGGTWQAVQVGADGTELPFAGRYREVVEPERLVFTFEDLDDPGSPNVEVATVTLREVGGVTEMTLHQAGTLPAEQYELMHAGYSAFFERLAEHLARD